jgi:Leucine-rich repeat (LRR) protein
MVSKHKVHQYKLKCDYGYYDGSRIAHADLSSKTIGASFTFSGVESSKHKTTWIWFDKIGRVAHLPRNLFKVYTNLDKLQIPDSDIPILKNDFFKPEFKKFRRLELTHDNIKMIDENAFRHLKNLTEFDFSNNEISSLPIKLFHKNRKLKKINLSRNKIKVIPPGTVKNLNHLVRVDLWANECVDQSIGCQSRGCDEKLEHTELERSLQQCYESHTKSLNLLSEGENDK